MNESTIIFFNGTSSSGKTTLIQKLQQRLESPFLECGLDKFIWMLPRRYFYRPLWDDVLGKADESGEYGHTLVRGMHRAVASLADSGLNILADHVLVERSWVQDCANLFKDRNAFLIGIQCDLSILETREKERKDRTLGQAKAQYNKVHAHCVYDFEIDSGVYSVEENINRIVEFFNSEPLPKAFKQLNSEPVHHE